MNCALVSGLIVVWTLLTLVGQSSSEVKPVKDEDFLQFAIRYASPGDIIVIDVPEINVTLPMSTRINGTVNEPIILRGRSEGPMSTLNHVNPNTPLTIDNAYWRIENLQFSGGGNGRFIDIAPSADWVTIRNVTFDETQVQEGYHSMVSVTGKNVEVDSCRFLVKTSALYHDGTTHGMHNSHFTVKNSVFVAERLPEEDYLVSGITSRVGHVTISGNRFESPPGKAHWFQFLNIRAATATINENWGEKVTRGGFSVSHDEESPIHPSDVEYRFQKNHCDVQNPNVCIYIHDEELFPVVYVYSDNTAINGNGVTNHPKIITNSGVAHNSVGFLLRNTLIIFSLYVYKSI